VFKFYTYITLKQYQETQDFCAKARKRRRRVPKGTLGGADVALVQKDKFIGTVLR